MATATLNKTAKKYKAILDSGFISENDLIHMRSSMSTNQQLKELVFERMKQGEVRISESHQDKGIKYLLNLWKTPSGRERKNNPFSVREQHVLSNYSHFTLVGFEELGGIFKSYPAVFRCYSKGGDYFDYYWNGNGITKCN